MDVFKTLLLDTPATLANVSGVLPIINGGTNATTAADARTNLGLGTAAVVNLGTGVATFLTTPSSANLAAALTDETGTGAVVFATSPTLVTPALGTPSALVGTNITGTASGLTAGHVTTNANLTGVITSVGNATSIASQTGTGTKFVVDTSPVLVTPNLGTPSAAVLTSATGLPLSTGVTGTLPAANGGTGVANNAAMTVTGSGNFAYTRTLTGATNVTFPTTGTLATLAGSETLTNKTLTSPTLTTPALGTPASGVVTNLTGTASININGTVGATTPSTGAFSTLSATDNLTLSTGVISRGQINGSITGPCAVYDLIAATGNNRLISFGKDNSTNGFFTVSSTRANGSNNVDVASFTSAGAAITGTLSATGTITASGGVLIGNGIATGLYGDTGNLAVRGYSTGGIYIQNATGSSTFGLFNSAGLAVTGTLSATGNITTSAGNITTSAGSIYALAGEFQVGSASKMLYFRTLNGGNHIDSYDNPITGTVPLQINASTTIIGSDASTVVISPTGLAVAGALSSTTGANFATSSGNVGIGVTIPAAKLEVNGDVIFGTQSPQSLPSASNAGFYFANPYNVGAARFSGGSYTGSLTLVNVYNGNGVVGSVVTNGSTTAWNITSDARLKTNLRDITNSSAIIDALKPRRFDWLTFSKEKDDYGFVAQEAYEVYPKMVTVGGDDPAEKPWGMDASKLIPVLVAELQSLRKRLAALEAK